MAERGGRVRAKGAAGTGAGRGAGAARAAKAFGTGARARLHVAFPGVSDAYERLVSAARAAGPLDARTLALVKVALSMGRGSSRGTHAHTRKALEAGVTPAALRHLVAVALPTLGLAATLDALRWIDETIDEQGAEPGR